MQALPPTTGLSSIQVPVSPGSTHRSGRRTGRSTWRFTSWRTPIAERDLIAAADRGVTVRVLLDKAFSGASANGSAAQYLAANGVEVKWAPAGYIFHIKTTTFDGKTSDISTANLVSKDYRTTRDAEIIDSDPHQVRAIERTFSNDWTAGASGSPRSQTVQSPGLIWSPNTGSGTAETALVKEITSARHTVDFESEELSDPAIYQALAADARSGVNCPGCDDAIL